MLDIREALKTALGASFVVTHAGPSGNVNLTIPVGDAGRSDELALPAVFVMGQAGTSENQNVGGKAVRNDTFCDLSIETIDADDTNGPLLVKDITEKIEALVRIAEKTLGSSYHSLVATFRDFPPANPAGGLHVYRRMVTVSGVNYEAY